MFMTKSCQYWQILAMTIFMISALYTQPKLRKCDKFVIFSVFSFGCLGRILYPCSDVCNMLIINGYFRFCDMCATSGANALIVS